MKKRWYLALGLSLISLGFVIMATLVSAAGTGTSVSPFKVRYNFVSQWYNGYVISVDIVNQTNAPITNWTISWNLGQGESFVNNWNANCRLSNGRATCTNMSYNATIGANGGTINFGAQMAANSGIKTHPTTFTVNGQVISTTTPTPATATATATTVRPTNTPLPTATKTAVPPTATSTPTVKPTNTPTVAPTSTPTVAPTSTPTLAPTSTPTAKPTNTPTVAPTNTPTVAPTNTPTVAPTSTPTAAPTATPVPTTTVAPQPGNGFIASVDTMKESRDTETRPMTDAQISASVNLVAGLNVTYITVDTHWDYASYMQRWVNAIRGAGKKVYFRIQPNQWENNNGVTGLMTPAGYKQALQSFILSNPGLFQPGDIFDPCPEPENGPYWIKTYGSSWTSGAPNTATRDFNAFIRDTTDVSDNAFHQLGIFGVITTVRSTNSFFASHPGPLEAATVQKMGRVTFDSYPEEYTTDPATAVSARLTELNAIRNAWPGVPLVIGEMGYSNKIAVDDTTQANVLGAEFNAIRNLSYISGVNYWVGAGTNNSGGYTHIFNGNTGSWTLRPAAGLLNDFFKFKRGLVS